LIACLMLSSCTCGSIPISVLSKKFIAVQPNHVPCREMPLALAVASKVLVTVSGDTSPKIQFVSSTAYKDWSISEPVLDTSSGICSSPLSLLESVPGWPWFWSPPKSPMTLFPDCCSPESELKSPIVETSPPSFESFESLESLPFSEWSAPSECSPPRGERLAMTGSMIPFGSPIVRGLRRHGKLRPYTGSALD
jgi:hypothetical protein